jgi:hypothetical protein
MLKTVWTLNIGDYAPKLCELTYPLILAYAKKIGADFRIINERHYPDFPVVYEKLQIFHRGRGNDWNVYIDSDAMVFPDMFDITERIPKDTVAHWGQDHASNRWRYDNYFRRDGRDIGSCNWFTAASDWCIDLWHPLDDPPEDLSLADTIERIQPITKERLAGITPEHLIDDYVLSRNIARYGLKLKTVQQIQKEDSDAGVYFWHTHTLNLQTKIDQMRAGLTSLNLLPMASMSLENWIAEYGVAPVQRKVHADRAAR